MSSDRAVPAYVNSAPARSQEGRGHWNRFCHRLLSHILRQCRADAAGASLAVAVFLFCVPLAAESVCTWLQCAMFLPGCSKEVCALTAAGFASPTSQTRIAAGEGRPSDEPSRKPSHKSAHGYENSQDDGFRDANRRRSVRDARLRRLLGDPFGNPIRTTSVTATASSSRGQDERLHEEAVAAGRRWVRMFGWLVSADVRAEVGARHANIVGTVQHSPEARPMVLSVSGCQNQTAWVAALSGHRQLHRFALRFGVRFACASADAIGPRSRFGVLGSRKSLPAFDASDFDVAMRSSLRSHQ